MTPNNMKLIKKYTFALLASNILGIIVIGELDVLWFIGSFIGATFALLFDIINN